MPFYPMPVNLMLTDQSIKFLPKFAVFDGLFVSGTPAVLFPPVNPPCNAVFNVAAVKMNDDGTRPFDRRECTNDSRQLHLVVGCKRAAAIELQSVLTPDEPGSPPPNTGIFLQAPSVQISRTVGVGA